MPFKKFVLKYKYGTMFYIDNHTWKYCFVFLSLHSLFHEQEILCNLFINIANFAMFLFTVFKDLSTI